MSPSAPAPPICGAAGADTAVDAAAGDICDGGYQGPGSRREASHVVNLCLPTVMQLTGLDPGHVATVPDQLPDARMALHPEAISALTELRAEAAVAGFDLQVASGYRDYDRQLKIWNAKATGRRPLLDAAEKELDLSTLEPERLLYAILYWSALPGCSRHHWGSDMDVFDAAAITEGYELTLTCGECEPGGPFAALHRWLDERMLGNDCYGFFRPYAPGGNDVAVEPWHLSWAPLAVGCQRTLNPEILLGAVKAGRPELNEVIEQCFDSVYCRYIEVPASRYPAAFRAELSATSMACRGIGDD